MTKIPIDKKRGIAPHIITCARCGEEHGISLGVIMEGTDAEGNKQYKNKGDYKYNRNHPYISWEEITDPDRKIAMGHCTACEDELARFAEELAKGSIFFKCEQCTTTGMIIGSHPLAEAVRKQTGVVAPNPVGIEFATCEEHTPQDE